MPELITAIDAALAAVPPDGYMAAAATYQLERCRELAVNAALLDGRIEDDDPLRYPAPLEGTRAEAMAANLGTTDEAELAYVDAQEKASAQLEPSPEPAPELGTPPADEPA